MSFVVAPDYQARPNQGDCWFSLPEAHRNLYGSARLHRPHYSVIATITKHHHCWYCSCYCCKTAVADYSSSRRRSSSGNRTCLNHLAGAGAWLCCFDQQRRLLKWSSCCCLPCCYFLIILPRWCWMRSRCSSSARAWEGWSWNWAGCRAVGGCSGSRASLAYSLQGHYWQHCCSKEQLHCRCCRRELRSCSHRVFCRSSSFDSQSGQGLSSV